MDDVVKSKTDALMPLGDGFDERDDEQSTGGADYVKFDGAAQHMWHGRDGAGLYLGPYMAVNCTTELLRWCDQKVIDRITEKPLPDPDLLNEKIPRS